MLSPDINFCWFPGNCLRRDILEFLQFVATCKPSVEEVEIFYGNDAPAEDFSFNGEVVVLSFVAFLPLKYLLLWNFNKQF